MYDNIINSFAAYPNYNDSVIQFDEPYIRPLNRHVKYNVLLSNTGTGKTTNIVAYLKFMLDNNNTNNALIITSRTTFGSSLMQILKDNNMSPSFYLDDNFDGENYKIGIVQAESLNKIIKAPDILILDEFVSVSFQFFSPYHKNNLKVNQNTFKNFIIHANYIVFSDAFIYNDYCCHFFKNILPSNSFQLQINRYTKPKTVIEHKELNTFYAELNHKVLNNEKIFFVSGAIKQLKTVVEFLTKECQLKDNEILLINKETSDSIIRELNPNVQWDKYKFVGITSTITNGVDCSIEHFDTCFVYADSSTVCARDYYQMINRVRNLKSNTINLFIRNIPHHKQFPNLSDVINDVKMQLNNVTDIITKKINKDALEYIKNNYAIQSLDTNRMVFYTIESDNIFTSMYIHSIFEVDQSRSNFTKIINDFFRHNNWIVVPYETDPVKYIDIRHSITTAKNNVDIKRANRYDADKNKFDQENLNRLRFLNERRCMTHEDKLNLEHAEFVNIISKNIQDKLNGNIFNKYNKKQYQIINLSTFKNLCNGTISIEHLAVRDIVQTVHNNGIEHYDKTLTDKFSLIFQILQSLGFKNYDDIFTKTTNHTHIVNTCKQIKKSWPLLKSTFRLANKYPKDNVSDIRIINSILYKMFNIKMDKLKNDGTVTKQYSFKVDDNFKMLADNAISFVGKHIQDDLKVINNNDYMKSYYQMVEHNNNQNKNTKAEVRKDTFGKSFVHHIPLDPHKVRPEHILM